MNKIFTFLVVIAVGFATLFLLTHDSFYAISFGGVIMLLVLAVYLSAVELLEKQNNDEANYLNTYDDEGHE